MSLRARLVAGLLLLAAAGLLILGGVTYVEQRSFLEDRLDSQATSAIPVINKALVGIEVGPSAGDPGRGGRGGRGINLPPGTYGEHQDSFGEVIDSVTLSYGQQAFAAPLIPAPIEVNKLITVGSVGDSGLRYRVVAERRRNFPYTTIAAIPMQEVDQTLERLLLVEALVIAAVLLALGALSWLLVGIGLRPLDRMAQTADAIAAGDLSHRVEPATPRSEVGRLGLALNGMLGRLEGSFAERQAVEERLRRFLADASHELRTPLTSIRGYAELLRTGAASDPQEAAKAMRRIEEEAARMGVLVEDLLTLARLDELRDPVRAPVDICALAGDAVNDAGASAPQRTITLNAPQPVVISADRDQIQQIFANLMRNALVHTPSDTAIELTVSREGADARLDVRDHGPGLPTGENAALFERFWRAEGGRTRGKGSAGLGLAIVAAIVAAHGGRVSAKDADGGGAQFTVWLPLDGS